MLLTCRHIRQLHDAFVDGELSPSLTAEVHAHLLQCPECQQQVEMLRAVSDVIAKDDAAPALPADFATRVAAQLPQAADQTLRFEPRARAWRAFSRIVVPAMAASLFVAIVFWPQQDSGNTKVAGASAMKSVVDPTMAAVAGTQKAANSLNKLLTISVDQASANMKQDMEKVEQIRQRAAEPTSFSTILLMPFNELPQPIDEPAPPAGDGKVRF